MESHPSDPSAHARGFPELFDLGVKARSLAFLFTAGAAVGALTLVFPHASEVDETGLLLLVIGAGAVGAGLYFLLRAGARVAPPRRRSWSAR